MSTIIDGVYRIRADSHTPPLYFEWQTDNSVQAAGLDAESTPQMWKITIVEQPSTFTITGVAGFVQLSMLKYTEGGVEKIRVVSGGKQEWIFQAKDQQFVIGPADIAGKCIDLGADNSLMILDSKDAANQHFSLEAVPIPVAPGDYSIRNRATQGVLSVWTGFDQGPTRVHVRPGVTNSDYNTWAVEPTRGGYTIKNTQAPLATLRWLADDKGPIVMSRDNVCRLSPVSGTDFYYIKMSREEDAFALTDTNPVGTTHGLASSAEYFELDDDRSQQWEFIKKQ